MQHCERNGNRGYRDGTHQKRVDGPDTRREDEGRRHLFWSLTIVCDGCASRFRKDYIQRTPITTSKFYGLEKKDAVLPAPYHGHVILGDSSPILLYQIGTHETRALIDVKDGCRSSPKSRIIPIRITSTACLFPWLAKKPQRTEIASHILFHRGITAAARRSSHLVRVSLRTIGSVCHAICAEGGKALCMSR
ncbi:uncharacterized protein PV09_08042 [Verruconis gallopava]|uniref:Squalene monooxygenase n=1 Tax=Verruconis gallopava TaxID=253628 RepID=A0A0D2AMG8_9PEZI|nr:uncharacterized protein PV09_08042 [Verruconis gallopava]KIW00329.1 hypothetical protein PV09_08042 [Verruconis gallopava]